MPAEWTLGREVYLCLTFVRQNRHFCPSRPSRADRSGAREVRGGKDNNGHALRARGEAELPGMEKARPNALEVAEEADAPTEARTEDAAALIPRGHGVARYPSGLQSGMMGERVCRLRDVRLER